MTGVLLFGTLMFITIVGIVLVKPKIESFVQWPPKRFVDYPIADNRYHHQEYQSLTNTSLFASNSKHPIVPSKYIPHVGSKFEVMKRGPPIHMYY